MQQLEANPGNVLFICTGNICRSPMAEALLGKVSGQDHGVIGSAGLRGMDGEAVHPLAREQMDKRGIDISGHRARSVTPNLLVESSVILVMEAAHQAWLESKMPMVRGRVNLLGYWRGVEVLDPIGGGRSDFELCAAQIEQCLLDWAPHLVRLWDRAADRRPAVRPGNC
jgi:protein-tyrosine phosphatase